MELTLYSKFQSLASISFTYTVLYCIVYTVNDVEYEQKPIVQYSISIVQ